MDETDIGLWGVPLAILGGAIRVSTPFIFVTLGECHHRALRPHQSRPRGHARLRRHERLRHRLSDRLALARRPRGGVRRHAASALFHGWICKLPKVNDIAIGIALMLFGMGLAFFFGKPFIQPVAPDLPAIPFGCWSRHPAGAGGARGQRPVPDRHRARRLLWWMFREHASSA